MLKKIIYWIVLFLLPVVLLEGGCRVLLAARGLYGDASGTKTLSDKIGWTNQANLKVTRYLKNYGGLVPYSTGYEGFNLYGNPETAVKKIFVIGDSYTDAQAVGESRAYYSYLKTFLGNTEIFVYGCSGYGSLQEYLILDAYIDRIRPDLILWQFCDNDLINNDYELESLSYMNNNHLTRPYWINHKIELRYPAQIPRWLYGTADRSYFFRYIAGKWDLARSGRSGETIENTLTPEGPLYQRALRTTSQIMGLVKKRAPSIPVVAFLAHESQWTRETDFQQVTADNGILFIPGIPALIEEGRRRGLTIDGSPADPHWNEVGHKLVGRRIANALAKLNY